MQQLLKVKTITQGLDIVDKALMSWTVTLYWKLSPCLTYEDQRDKDFYWFKAVVRCSGRQWGSSRTMSVWDTNAEHTSAHSHNTPRDTTTNTMQVTAGAIRSVQALSKAPPCLYGGWATRYCCRYCASEARLPVQQKRPSGQLYSTGL